MKRRIRLLIALVLLAALLSLVFAGCAVADTKPSALSQNSDEQTTDKNPTQPVEDPESSTPSAPSNPGEEVTPTNPSTPEVNPGEDTPDTPEVTLTEAEYKAMFLEELTSNIQEYYNNKASSVKTQLHDIEIADINFADGTVYFNCVRNNQKLFYTVNNSSLADYDSFEELSGNVPTEFNKISLATVQEQSLANEIAEFALEQDAVKDFLAQNGISTNADYTVLNATEFNSKDGIRTSNVVLKINNKILKFDIGGATGACASQEEYINKIKNGYLDRLENFEISNYSELSSASASESYTFTSSYGNVKGTMFFNNGIGSMQFEEQSM